MPLILHNSTLERVQFRLKQAGALTGSLLIEAGSTLELEPEERYTLKVVGKGEGWRIEQPLTFCVPRGHVVAIRRGLSGAGAPLFYGGEPPFTLQCEPQLHESSLFCENTTRERLTFHLTRERPRLQGMAILTQWQTHSFPLVDTYEVCAVINGCLTMPLQLNGLHHSLEAAFDKVTGQHTLRLRG